MVYLFTEQNAQQLSQLTPVQRFVNTLFLAVTPRTAGFDTIPFAHLSMAGIVFTMVLMFIGGTLDQPLGESKPPQLGY